MNRVARIFARNCRKFVIKPFACNFAIYSLKFTSKPLLALLLGNHLLAILLVKFANLLGNNLQGNNLLAILLLKASNLL